MASMLSSRDSHYVSPRHYAPEPQTLQPLPQVLNTKVIARKSPGGNHRLTEGGSQGAEQRKRQGSVTILECQPVQSMGFVDFHDKL